MTNAAWYCHQRNSKKLSTNYPVNIKNFLSRTFFASDLYFVSEDFKMPVYMPALLEKQRAEREKMIEADPVESARMKRVRKNQAIIMRALDDEIGSPDAEEAEEDEEDEWKGVDLIDMYFFCSFCGAFLCRFSNYC